MNALITSADTFPDRTIMLLKSKSAPNSMILVTDPAGHSVPTWDSSNQIAAGPDCVVIRCRGDRKSETEIQFGQAREVDPGYQPLALRTLLTPSRVLVIGSVEGEILGRLRTLDVKTSILIWVNDRTGPDRIAIGLYSADVVRVPSPPDANFRATALAPAQALPWHRERLAETSRALETV